MADVNIDHLIKKNVIIYIFMFVTCMLDINSVMR